MATESKELHPILVSEVADEESLDLLRSVASERGVAFVPLAAAPVDRRLHVLEVYVPGAAEAERFFAEPVGGPTPEGFPLKLDPYGEKAPATTSDPPTAIRAARAVRGAHETSPTLTHRHSQDLGGSMGSPVSEDEGSAYLGRELGGGKYRLEAPIGHGGMGAVLRAFHRDLRKDVAVKVLHGSFNADPQFATRFQAEALTMSKIDHPNVTRVLDFGQEPDGLLYLVMEFLDGRDLQAILDDDGPLPVERLARLMIQVTMALGHVHRHGIIHRDVKPTNILVVAGVDEDDQPTETAKVCDFGIALARGSEGRVAGTPEYMSPEQCRGAELDARSDVYACGVLLYELATGKLPFEAQDATELMRMHIQSPPPPPSSRVPELDPLLESIVLKSLAKDPAERPASMRHLRHELRELLAPVLLEAGPAGPVSQAADRMPESSPSLGAAEGWLEPDARSMPPRAEAEAGGDSWLVDRNEGYGAFFTTLAGTVEKQAGASDGEELIATLTRDPSPWLNDLAATLDFDQYAERIELLKPVVRTLMTRADAVTLAEIVTTMRRVLKEEPGETNPRIAESARILRSLRSPRHLAPIVDRILEGAEELPPAFFSVLYETQAAGVEALLEGRARHATPLARYRFVTFVRGFGAAGLALLRPALQEALLRGERSGPFVEDLLAAVPPLPDEGTGKIVAEFLKGGEPTVAAAALVALASLWGERSRPLLLGALESADDAIRIAALAGLRVLKGIDPQVVRRVAPMLAGAAPASDDLRVAAAAALSEAIPAARAEASDALLRGFNARPPARTGVFASVRAPTPAGPAAIAAMAHAMLVLAVPEAPALIQERAAASPEPLRRQLLALLGL